MGPQGTWRRRCSCCGPSGRGPALCLWPLTGTQRHCYLAFGTPVLKNDIKNDISSQGKVGTIHEFPVDDSVSS